MIPNPKFILAAVIACLLAFWYGHHKGWWERDAEMQMEIARKNAEARETEQKLAEQINSNSKALMEANNAINEKQSALDRAIRNGRVRLPAASCVQSAQSPTPAAGDRDEAPSESERQTLLAIAAIAAEGDRAIVQLNACIDAYQAVREQLNGSNR